MPDRLRIGIAGCGVGKAHLTALLGLPELYEVRALCDLDEPKLKALAAEKKIPAFTTDFNELLRRDDLDAISVCTPPWLHRKMCEQILASDKHCICEKPLAGSLRELDELAVIEMQSGRRLMPIFQYRFGHGFQRLKQLIKNGLAGTPYLATVETAWRRRAEYFAAPWRGKWATELGGTLVGHAVHGHDALLHLMGPVKTVFARSKKLVHPQNEVEDTVVAALELQNGALASLSATLGSAEEISRHRFCFSGLSAESSLKPYSNGSEPWKFVGDTPDLQKKIDDARFTPLPEGYAGQFYRFYHALKQSTELPVTLTDARASLELTTAIYHSAATGENVTLPLASDHPRYTGWAPR